MRRREFIAFISDEQLTEAATALVKSTPDAIVTAGPIAGVANIIQAANRPIHNSNVCLDDYA